MELTHTRLLVDNYKECYSFYKDVLGFKVTWGNEDSNYCDFTFQGITLGIFERRQMVEAIGRPYTTAERREDRVALIFKVDNVEHAYEGWKEKVTFITEPVEQKDWGIKVAHFRDPDGNLLEIYQPIM
ncbi:Catechol 2,3-dioxygenase [Halobacillus karajensis]|uniref:VOC family protein n=1 Tax=Halobacillus karajensis TaxID=195088 RepID=UPI0008A7C63A|nr:VOC family protein [Halobacillus karajensis]SEI01599.1 Catechol 2,3-dioxygenase [Halobacillus karajensis]